MSSKGVILVGGPSVGTRFRPLSMDCPKPLFPIAGFPMIYHHVAALAKLPSIKEILLVGFFDNSVFDRFLTEVQMEFYSLSIRYLREYQSLGTGGGIYHFRDEIMRGNPDHIFVMNADICSSFPLQQMLDFHTNASPNAVATVLGIRVDRSTVRKYGCLVIEPSTHEVRHFVEKPETFISDLISCGVYLFSKEIFGIIREAIIRQRAIAQEAGEEGYSPPQMSASPRVSISASPSTPSLLSAMTSKGSDERIRLEQDVLASLAGSGKLFAYVGTGGEDFWMQIKTGSSVIPANRLYLQFFRSHQPRRLSNNIRHSPTAGVVNGGPPPPQAEIIQPVYIHPTAIIHPSAKIGPNVSIGPRVLIARGVRVRDAIVLDSSDIRNDAAVLHSIVGWESKIGAWARVEGHTSSAAHDGGATAKGTKIPSATILGKDVTVADEVIIRNCIVLPHKELKSSFHSEILM